MLNKKSLFVFFLIPLLISSTLVAKNGKDKDNGKKDSKPEYRIVVEPDSVFLQIGDLYQFTAFLMDTSGNRKDTTFIWSLTNRNAGLIDDNGLFQAVRNGGTQVLATLDRLTGRGKVVVEGDTTIEGPKKERVVVAPRDTLLLIGEQVQFQATYYNAQGVPEDTAFKWSLTDSSVGSLLGAGLFQGDKKGHTRVVATLKDGEFSSWGHAVVHEDSALEQELRKGYHIQITPPSVVLAEGDSIQFAAALYDSMGNTIDTAFSWSADIELGVIDEDGWFFANNKARGFVFASVGDLTDKARVQVREIKEKPEPPGVEKRKKVVVVPADSVIMIGDTLQFEAYLVDEAGRVLIEDATWELRGNNAGTLSEDGLFIAEDRGMSLVQARYQSKTGIGKVMVTTEQDTANADSVKIRFQDRDGSQIGNLKRIREDVILKISGMPFPLNFLNGAELSLPSDSLDEDIRLDVTLSDLAELLGDSTVSYAEAILTSVAFHVYVNDTLISPYYFDEPVHLTLPYKPDLMADLGITVDDLGIFFYDESAGVYDPSGIVNVVLDTANNKIHADILHFSQLVVGDLGLCGCEPTSVIGQLPEMNFKLYANYPNPFNPDTEIRFDLGGNGLQDVRLSIFNILGQEVAVLVNGQLAAGAHSVQWNGKDMNGHSLVSGVYIYRLETPVFTRHRRMIMLK